MDGLKLAMEPHLVPETRRRILSLVRRKPGAHLRALARELGYPLGTTVYHLDRLVQADLVVARQDGRYKRFFAANEMGRREKEIVMVLHRDVPRRLVDTLLSRGGGTQRELASLLRVSRSTLSAHVTSLVRAGIVRCENRWPENSYSIAEPDVVRAVLRQLEELAEDEATSEAPEAGAPETAVTS